jgi:hypothetical protein
MTDLSGIGQIVTGVGVICTAVFGYLNHRKIGGVETTVNGRQARSERRSEQLAAALEHHDIPIPNRPGEEAPGELRADTETEA